MQKTGYRDRRGLEILEGDISRIVLWHAPKKKPVMGVVRAYDGRSRFAIYANRSVRYSCEFKTGGRSGNTPAVEVIGNMRENPGLLE